MSVYTYRRRVIRGVGLRRTTPEPTPDFARMSKAEVVEYARAHGVDSTGTKAEIVARLT